GLWRWWRRGGHRVEVIAVLSTVGLYFAGLTLAARGGPGAQIRYVFPYVLLLLPYAAYEALERWWPPLRAWLAARLATMRGLRLEPGGAVLAVLGVVLVARLALA